MEKNQTSTAHNTTAKLLVSFTDVEGSNHYFCSSRLGGGEAIQLCDLPGCNSSPCKCYVSDAVNGVLCFSNGKDVYVLNPATRDILTLPKSSTFEGYAKRDSPLVYSVYAFGFDPSNQEFKVLHIFGTHDGSAFLHNQQCEVFTVRIKTDDNGGEKKRKEVVKVAAEKPKEVVKKGRGKPKGEKKDVEEEEEEQGDVWRKAASLPPCPYTFQSQGVCVNGSVYWIGRSSPADPVIVSMNPKDQRGVKFYVLVGDDSTGDMVVMRGGQPETYEVVCLSGNKNTAAERAIRIGGIPSWVDLESGKNNTNFRLDNYVESRVPLDPVLVIVKEEKKPEVKEADGAAPTQKPPPRTGRPAQKTHNGGYRPKAHGAHAAQQHPPRTHQGRAQPPRQSHVAQNQQRLPRASQPAQKAHQARAQPLIPKARGAQADDLTQQQPPSAPPASQPAQKIRYGRAQPAPSKARQFWIRFGEIDVQVI